MTGRIAFSLLLGLALVVPASTAWAQQSKLIGSVTAVDATAGTVAVAESNGTQKRTFRVDRKSKIIVHGTHTSVNLADLAVGSAVVVTYAPGDGEILLLRRMEVTPPKASTPE